MKNLVITFILSICLFGCQSTDSNRTFTYKDNIHAEEVIPLNNNYTKDFEFSLKGIEFEDVKGKVIQEVNTKLSTYFSSQSVPLRQKKDTYDSVLDGLRVFSAPSNIKVSSNVNWKVNDSGLFVSYETVQNYNGRKATAYQRYNLPISFQHNKTSQSLIMTIKAPEAYIERNGNMGSESMIIPPFESDELDAIIKESFDAVTLTRIGFYKEKSITGDFVVNYGDDSVYANFIQLGVNLTTEHRIQKTAIISLKNGDMKYTTEVQVYPYRDVKSKVTYKSNLTSIQWLNSDGTTSIDRFVDKAYIEKMLSDIANG